MQKPLIIANWKMNPSSFQEASHLFEVVRKGMEGIKDAEAVLCPPYIWLFLLVVHLNQLDARIYLGQKKALNKLRRFALTLGAQNCYWEMRGAYTGEVSPLMLKNLGCQYVIIGHSERRKYFGETDEIINKKLKSALKARLKPVLCVGEELRDTFNSEGRPLNEMGLAVQEQTEKGLQGVSIGRIRDVVIVYEPVWAISANNGFFCSSDEALQARLFIKKILTKLYNRQTAEQVRILYGGSVDAQNAADYLKGAGMNGLLVGGASLNGSEFVRIAKVAVSGREGTVL